MTVLDVSESTFKSDVLDRSHEVPVVVDFWADWCGPCHRLGPVLEKLANEADGDWILAKVDVDANPQLASVARVQGIPAVRAFVGGQLVAEFTGAIPEPDVRQWLEKLGPSPAKSAIEAARRAEDETRYAEALADYRKALDIEPNNEDARMGVARLELEERVDGRDEDVFRQRLDANPSDLEAALRIADLSAARGNLHGAFDVLLDVVRIGAPEDRDGARKRLLDLLDILPLGDPMAMSVRRLLAAALY
ncbi:MAG: putative thioredoxin [Actinomycetota bacterium]|nr:putative thioredoxin [Actinomycetota bacterium]